MFFHPVKVATLNCPDAPPEKVRSRQTKRGQKAKGNRGGRPPKQPKKERRLKFQNEARKMHRQGMSLRKIGNALCGIAHTTIADWVKG